jgi:hypothetical protein
MLEFLIDNRGIPMGTNYAPLLSNFFYTPIVIQYYKLLTLPPFFSGEATNNNCIVLGLTREHANHYATDAVIFLDVTT